MANGQPTIAELIGRISARLRQALADSFDSIDTGGLTPAQSRVVGFIEANERRGVIQREIADMTGTRAASVSAMISALESDGWIERRPDPHDSRRKTLYVTDKGRETVKRFEASMWTGVDEHIGGLSDTETNTLIELLTKVDRHLAG